VAGAAVVNYADAPVYIYGLVDPRSGALRYVGKSIRPLERLTNHMNERSRCHRTNWLASLRRDGVRPRMVILDVTGEGGWQDVERGWIAWAKARGCDLVNETSGGDGVCDLPAETRARMRLTWLGRKHKPETIAKLGSGMRGKHHTEEHRAKMRRVMTGRTVTWGNKLAEAVRALTEQDVSIILDRLNGGELVKDLAAEYGVHRTTLSKIKMGTYFVRGQRVAS